jgi:N-acetylglutamate synthase-like GNAT family acetyltransferase
MNGKYNLKMDKDVKTYVFFNKPGKNIMKQFLKYDDAETNKYKDISEYIMQLITKSEFLCKGLTHSYVKKTFARVDAVVVIGSSMNILPNGNIYGFALIEFDIKNDSVHIDVICSHYGVRGAGEKLIKEVEIICNKVHLNQIYLTSVDTAITFYEKYGFVKNRKHCVDMCLMTKVLKKSSSKSPKSPKSPKIPKSPRNKKKHKKNLSVKLHQL